MRWLLGVACLLWWSGRPVSAAEVAVHLVDGHGHAVSDAVITLVPDVATATTLPSPPAEAAVTHIVDQKDETFIPYVQVFRPGDKVMFRNSDTTRHHVYSFAAVKTFEFVLRPGEISPVLSLDKPGIAAVGCNIHDHMIAYLFVSAAPAIAVSNHAGDATLGHLAAGHYTAHVWHPQLHPGQPEQTQAVTISGDADTRHLAFRLSLMPDPREFMDREHMEY